MLGSQSLGVDIPPPLHIIKRGKSMQVLRSNPRDFSGASFEEDGPDQPLTVIKCRKSRARANTKCQINDREPVLNRGLDGRSRSISMSKVSSTICDPVIPKPSKAPVSRRSSSLQVRRPASPTFLSKLRSLSNRRASSSKTTSRRHVSRISSIASDESIFQSSDENESATLWHRSSSPSYSEHSSRMNDFEPHRFGGNHFTNIQGPADSVSDPYMLIPHISITPESRILNEGQPSIWAAIEISGRLFHPRASDSTDDLTNPGLGEAPFMPVNHCDTGLSRYGFLYNVNVEVLPTVGGSVFDLIGNAAIRTISPGSNHLILARVGVGASKAQNSGASRRDADNLIADLEHQLGDFQTEYLQVKVNYYHSGFPEFGNTLAEEGTSVNRTRLETSATGVIKRHNPASTWSPRPVPVSNPLFAIMASHWGPARANEVMYRNMSSRSSCYKVINRAGTSQNSRNEDTIKTPERIGIAPSIPPRRASLTRLSLEKIPDPARKIWTELRQTSSGNRPAFHVSKADRLPAATTFIDAPDPSIVIRPASTQPESKAEVQRQREVIREIAVRNKRSIGADSLKSLVPSVVGSSPEGKENGVFESPSPPTKRLDGGKREGRWSLGNWW
ncbi:hypothetical protein F5Y04DRAFT_9911 [Hypomontagnella monticulosa]|nr:hypothetical protein F5Y04DRAFT_9911 [Hypomontagnella monticulosa]